MVAKIKQVVTVQEGGRIEIRAEELPAGARVTVEATVSVEPAPTAGVPTTEAGNEGRVTWASLRGAGKGLFVNEAEVDAYIRSERDAWDR
jgi:hypothetical protein